MLSNRNEALLRQEFKRRYLTEFAGYVGGLMEESGGGSANFLLLLLVVLLGPVSLPVAALVGVGLSMRYARVEKSVRAALDQAVSQAALDLQSETAESLPQVERWLDRHADDLPTYLDKLDRYEEERRKVKSLIERANRSGSTDGLSAGDRALLKRHGVSSFKPPLHARYDLTPRCQLGSWHFSQLDRALWRDIAKLAGPRGKMVPRMLGLDRLG